jgi:hypothetical protein
MIVPLLYHHHHQPINVLTAGAQAFMDYTHKENRPYPTTRAQFGLVGFVYFCIKTTAIKTPKWPFKNLCT